MRQWILTGLTVALFLLMQTGCGREDTVYLQTDSKTDHTGQTTEVLTESQMEGIEAPAEKGTEAQAASPAGSTTDVAEVSGTAACFVYVCGAVDEPGVYELPEGSRICDAISLAGGLTAEACVDVVNQAEPVTDGQMIRIPTKAEAEAGLTGLNESSADASTGTQVSAGADDGRVNLNTAGTAEFMTLPGIGEAKAASIVAYRKSHGAFGTVEEIMNVEGIKEGVYNRIKEYIKVN